MGQRNVSDLMNLLLRLNQFHANMITRAVEAWIEGREGWDTQDVTRFRNKITEKSNSENPIDLIDLANNAMFTWYGLITRGAPNVVVPRIVLPNDIGKGVR